MTATRETRRGLAICSEMIVLRLSGWTFSRGIAAEIAAAQHLGLQVTYR